MQKTEQTEQITVERKVLSHMISDIEHLIDDIETIMSKDSTKTLDKRLNEVRSGRVKGLTERDFNELMRKDGINAG